MARKFKLGDPKPKRLELNVRIGTFRENIFSMGYDEPYEFDVMIYYDENTFPICYCDNIYVKHKNTVDTIAHHINSGDAGEALLNILDNMNDDDPIYLVGIDEALCTKATLFEIIGELKDD